MRTLQRLAVALAWLALVLGLVAPLAAADDGAGAEQAAGLTVDQERIDLGTVVSGQDAVAVFTFHNHSQRDIKIIRAKPS